MRSKFFLFFIFLFAFLLSSFDIKHLNSNNNTFTEKLTRKQSVVVKTDNFSAVEKELFNDKINLILNKYRFNGNILVARNGEVIFKKAKGYSNFKTKEPLSENTSFQLASVSKQFTAMAIMMLHEQGKLKYDDYVTKYLPGFPYKTITIKNLLSHTSGLQNYIYLVEKYWSKSKAISNEEVFNLFKLHPLPLNFKPGNNFNYSNTGYVFLALLIEKISHKPYSDFLKSNIFDRLGMKDTYVYDRYKILQITNRALSYSIGKKYMRTIDDNINDDIVGDKGIFSTIDDLYKWDKALYDNSLVKEATICEAFEAVTLNNNKTRDYGFGWRIKNDNGLKIIYHNGWWHGYKTSLTRFPEDKNTIIILNNTNSHIQGIISDVKKVLYPGQS